MLLLILFGLARSKSTRFDSKLGTYLNEESTIDYVTHDMLDTIQDYSNRINEHCCWNSEEENFSEYWDSEDEDCSVAIIKITIDGVTRWYEEW